jgi:hypothetical protein
MAAVDLSDVARQARETAEEDRLPEVVEADYAFVIYRIPSGQLVMSNELDTQLVGPQEEVEVKNAITGETEVQTRYSKLRGPTHDEVYFALQILLKDLLVNQTAVTTAQTVMQMQQQLVANMSQQGQMENLLKDLAREKH